MTKRRYFYLFLAGALIIGLVVSGPAFAKGSSSGEAQADFTFTVNGAPDGRTNTMLLTVPEQKGPATLTFDFSTGPDCATDLESGDYVLTKGVAKVKAEGLTLECTNKAVFDLDADIMWSGYGKPLTHDSVDIHRNAIAGGTYTVVDSQGTTFVVDLDETVPVLDNQGFDRNTFIDIY